MDSKIKIGNDISDLKGVGEATREKLLKLEIETIRDLLRHFPSRYLDYSSPKKISELKEKESASFTATISGISTFYSKSRRLITQATAIDQSGKIKLTWFNNPFIKRLITEGEIYTVAGKPSFFSGKLTIISPTIESGDSLSLNTKGLVPVYPLTAGLTSRWFRSKIFQILENISVADPLEEYINKQEIISLNQAYQEIHFPKSSHNHWLADKRISFNEHLIINLQNQLELQKLGKSLAIKINDSLNAIINNKIPFELTDDQKKTVQSIYSDLTKKDFSHRLIQGDTGSGKTITIVYAADQCLNNETSVILMAPTEILARQHFETFTKYSTFNKNVQLITGSTEEKPIINKPMIYIGTHALINQIPEKLKFPIALIAIDEQHKFGVKQRESLFKRNPVPHLINLSATPIPRTVALGLIGDIEISNIIHRPSNRLPTITHIVTPTRYHNSTDWMKTKLSEGNSLFVVCPNITDHGNDVSSVESVEKHYQKKYGQTFPIWTLHGKMKPEKQREIIELFKNSAQGILISTSLIEVGIDIPSANIMVIHSAERFGLAQLHQLRGRVGRGGKQAYCFLVPSIDDEIETERLKLLQKYDSGLVLAQKDLRLRGAGELFGLRQHGSLATRLKYFWSKKQFIKAKTLASKLVSHDLGLATSLLDKLRQA